MEDEAPAAGIDTIITQYETYQDYEDSQINDVDMFYLEDEELARQLVELGYRGSGEVLKREEFQARKRAAENLRLSKRSQPSTLASAGKDISDSPFLEAIAAREDANRKGKMNTIIFIRDRNGKGQEISGYIDLAHRIKNEDMEPYFLKKKRFLPRPSDLSFYNWETQTSTSNHTSNFQVVADNETGLLFKSKQDRKITNVDPKEHPGGNSVRVPIHGTEYLQVTIFDHVTRRKT